MYICCIRGVLLLGGGHIATLISVLANGSAVRNNSLRTRIREDKSMAFAVAQLLLSQGQLLLPTCWSPARPRPTTRSARQRRHWQEQPQAPRGS
jgi:hypothetical protein